MSFQTPSFSCNSETAALWQRLDELTREVQAHKAHTRGLEAEIAKLKAERTAPAKQPDPFGSSPFTFASNTGGMFFGGSPFGAAHSPPITSLGQAPPVFPMGDGPSTSNLPCPGSARLF